MRVQQPQVHQRTDRHGSYWFFRYWQGEPLPDGSTRTTRRFHTLGPSKGQNALTQLEAEALRDWVLAGLNTSALPLEAVVPPQQPKEVGALLFGNLAEMWRNDYVENPKIRLAEPTRIKYRTRLRHHILPCWRDIPIAQMRSKEILDWLHAECTSWYMMVDLRNIMSTIVTKAQEWEILPDTFANPTRRVKLGRRWVVRPEQILSEEETMQILARLDDPHRPMWDSGVRKALKIAARAVEHDFPGFGLHSLRRANITWRQEVGASAIEASKIAGHSSVNMTNDYTHVQLRRQDDLTRAIQDRLKKATRRNRRASA